MKNIVKIVLAVVLSIIIIFVLSLNFAENFIDIVEKDLKETGHGEILLPNGYSVQKIHAQKGNYLESEERGTMVEANIYEVGFNEKIIAYKREFGNSKEYGFIDTTIKDENYKPELVNEIEFDLRVRKLNINVEDVRNLFPETR